MISRTLVAVAKLLPVLFLIIITITSHTSWAKIVNKPKGPSKPVKVIVTKSEMNEAKAIVSSNRHFITDIEGDSSATRPSSVLARVNRIRNETIAKRAEEAEFALQVAVEIANIKKLSMDERRFGLRTISLDNTEFESCYYFDPWCPTGKYRTSDGTCNNLENPLWGSANTPFVRYLDADYSDGIQAPRAAASGKLLPSARLVSTQATSALDAPHKQYSHMSMQWGQFLDHDITQTPTFAFGYTNVPCCTLSSFFTCFPIDVPSDDPFFSQFGVSCLDFQRSAPTTPRDCNFGNREQMNSITAYIDASQIYGSERWLTYYLRTRSGGELRYTTSNGEMLLPPDFNVAECSDQPWSRPCFLAGDVRVNEQPNLIALHTIWLREHNRIAGRLSEINPRWNDETLFQETRRIVGAMLQHITYDAYLPKVIGEGYMNSRGLTPGRSLYVNTYDTNTDASVANEFATAAYRFGHSLIQGNLERYGSNKQLIQSYPISKVHFGPGLLYDKGVIDEMIRGLYIQQSQNFDRNFDKQVTNHLFARNNTNSIGLDLVALNIQRGRDHGIPSYIRFREACGFQPVRTFKDLVKDISNTDAKILETLYESVDDIDLYIGGLLEKSHQGGLVGETFQCIIGETFTRLKTGDRFFYENGEDETTRFSLDQLNEIRKVTLARVICDNTKITSIPRDVFRIHGPTESCDDIPQMDLSMWRDSGAGA